MDSYTLTVALYTFLTTSFVLALIILSTKPESHDKFLYRMSLMTRPRRKDTEYHALQQVETSPHRDAVEKFEDNYKASAQRTYLITMRANAELADLILRHVPDAECLINLAAHPTEQHHITVISARARSRSF